MGAWSGEPFGNDVAVGWAEELDDLRDWRVVRAALAAAIHAHPELDERIAAIGLAAAEVVAHGLGCPTQDDAYTGEVAAFVSRAGAPTQEVVAEAVSAVARAGARDGRLGRTWIECGNDHWSESVERLTLALRGLPLPAVVLEATVAAPLPVPPVVAASPFPPFAQVAPSL